MKYVMEIPGWRPALANELVGRHPKKIGRLKRKDVDNVVRAMLVFGVLPATGKRTVRIEISGRYSTFPDEDAPLKSGLDALKQAGAIIDDSAKWCDWSKPIFKRGPKATTITLEDIGPS